MVSGVSDLSVINLFVNFPLKSMIGAIISNMKGPFPFEFEEFNYSKSFPIWNCQLSKFSYSNFSHFVQPTPFSPQCIISHFIHTYHAATKTAKWSSKWNISNAKIFFFFGRQNITTILFCEEYFTNCLFSSLLGSKKGHFHLVCKMKIFCEGEREEFMNRDQLNLNCPL